MTASPWLITVLLLVAPTCALAGVALGVLFTWRIMKGQKPIPAVREWLGPRVQVQEKPEEESKRPKLPSVRA